MFPLRSAWFRSEKPYKMGPGHMASQVAKVGVVGSNPIARSSSLFALS
jgi:hypothetical protein